MSVGCFIYVFVSRVWEVSLKVLSCLKIFNAIADSKNAKSAKMPIFKSKPSKF
jgi:hypothetical protein